MALLAAERRLGSVTPLGLLLGLGATLAVFGLLKYLHGRRKQDVQQRIEQRSQQQERRSEWAAASSAQQPPTQLGPVGVPAKDPKARDHGSTPWAAVSAIGALLSGLAAVLAIFRK
jgi:type II secretory pathway pseudopilin PulG